MATPGSRRHNSGFVGAELRRPPPSERLLARRRLAPRRRGVALGRQRDRAAVAGARRNAVAPSPRITRLDLGGSATPGRRAADRHRAVAFRAEPLAAGGGFELAVTP